MSCTCQLKRMLRWRSRDLDLHGLPMFAIGEASDLFLGMRGFTIPGELSFISYIYVSIYVHTTLPGEVADRQGLGHLLAAMG